MTNPGFLHAAGAYIGRTLVFSDTLSRSHQTTIAEVPADFESGFGEESLEIGGWSRPGPSEPANDNGTEFQILSTPSQLGSKSASGSAGMSGGVIS